MTCREKLALEHPTYIGAEFGAGCYRCPQDYGYIEQGLCDGIVVTMTPEQELLCYKCWLREISENAEELMSKKLKMRTERIQSYKKHKNKESKVQHPIVDIIDYAVKQQDRTVSIYIHKDGEMSVTIHSVDKEEKEDVSM